MTEHISDEDLLSLIRKLDQHQGNSPLPPLPAMPAKPSHSSTGKSHALVSEQRIHIQANDQEPVTLLAKSPVVLLKNGQRAYGLVTAGPDDRIDWEIENTPLFTIEVSPDRMKAYLTVKAIAHYAWRLIDKPAARHLELEAEPDEQLVLDKLRLSDVMAELQRQHIIHNIQTSLIFKELQSPTYETLLIAEGTPPVPGKDAWIELFFSDKIESTFESEDGTVDFRNHLRIPTARKGDLIARKHPPVPGIPGYDVHGNTQEPSQPKDLYIFSKDNTLIAGDGDVFALAGGRPRMTENGAARYFDITTAHIVSGNVDLKTGNIVFSGDVIVYGDVTEEMIIESLGNVYVAGSVYKATITATGSIQIKGNIVGSRLFSGYYGVVFNRLYVHTKRMSELLQQLVEAARLLMEILESRGKKTTFKQIIMMLAETKFHELSKTAKEVIQTIRNIQILASTELNELREKMILLTSPANMHKISSMIELVVINNLVKETFEMVERMQETAANVTLAKCHMTEIKSTGSILLRGEGALQSNLYARENILFLNRKSVFRGGQLTCEGTISAYRIGGEHGSSTVVKAGKKIVLQRMTSGKLIVGRSNMEVLEPINEHTAVLEINGHLVLQPLGLADSPD